jgi:hypothetical protein
MQTATLITRLQYGIANTAIVILIPFLALQGMPPVDWLWTWAMTAEEVPDQPPVAGTLAATISPVANLTGVSVSPFNMFAPVPDRSNHRLRAKIEYRDGTIVHWRSPEWPELSCWQRFWSSRELEYIDKLSYYGTPQRRDAFADYLAARHRKQSDPAGAPRRVTFIIEEAIITDLNIDGWIPMSQPIPRSDEQVLAPKRIYPIPLELPKRQPAATTGAKSL